MKKILISYGDQRFYESLQRMKRIAKKSKIFDKIVLYTENSLPPVVTGSPLFSCPKGGGYWVWKPYIIMDTLSKCDIGDIVYYVDSGCTINAKSKEWTDYERLMINHNAILFQYRDNYRYTGWDKICKFQENNSAQIKHWIKPMTEDFFCEKFGDRSYLNFCKIWGGFIIIKKTAPLIHFIDEWYNITFSYPELIKDPEGQELENLPDSFNAHRHDQAIITPLAFYLQDIDKIAIIPETSESDKEHAAIRADRFRQAKMPFLIYLKYRIYNFIHS